MKSCWSEDILQAYLDGELAQEANDGVAIHLAECTACAARLYEAEQTWMAMDGALASEMPAVIPTARMRAHINAALAEKAAPKFTLTSLWNWKLAVVTAGILLVLAALFLRPVNLPPRNEQAVAPVPGRAPDFSSSPPPPPDRDVAQQPLKLRKRVPRQAPKVERVEVATPFYSLVEEGELAPLESGQVVRVEVPASTLIPFGFSVAADALTQPVQADLLYGQDGLARAIRFLPTTKTQ